MSEPTISSSSQPTHIPGLAPEATPVIGLGLGIAGLLLGVRPRLAALPLLATATAVLLYRDPRRVTPDEAATLFAPADGMVSSIDEIYEHRFLHTDALRIAFTRSLFDVHVTRSPVAGQVRYLEQDRSERTPQQRYERNYIGLDTSWGPLLVVQIADPVGRRIVCRVKAGDEVDAGERLGLVRFGSRVEVIVPRDVVRLAVVPGQRVQAGLSRVAALI